MSKIELPKAKDRLTENITIPMSKNQVARYRKVSHELSTRNLIGLHDLTRERIDMLLEEVETKLDSVSA